MMKRLAVIVAGMATLGHFSPACADVDISLNSPAELNGMGREEILALRRGALAQVPELDPGNYQPSQKVFGRIEDGKPWWGLLGVCYYGPGEKSILGNSKESRFLLNPYLLVGVEEAQAVATHAVPLSPDEFYPRPEELVWDDDRAWGRVTYNVSGFYAELLRYHAPDSRDLYLSDYNARDFGFNDLVIDAELSENIRAAFGQKIPIVQAIHVGPSCGYPGGCNNKSPSQPELKVQWTQLPARIYVKLWKKSPVDLSGPADMDFIIDLR